MSAGEFNTLAIYETDQLERASITVQPETLLLELNGTVNESPPPPATLPVSAVVSKGRRSKGLNARLVRVAWINAAPPGYDDRGVIALPWLAKATYDDLPKSATGTYLNFPVRLVGRTGEDAR
jgi:hypothetical protein